MITSYYRIRIYLHAGRPSRYRTYISFNPRRRLAKEVVIVIVISKLLERHSKAKSRAQTYSQVLRQIKGVVQKVVHSKLRSDFYCVRGDRVAVKVAGGCRLGREWEDG